MRYTLGFIQDEVRELVQRGVVNRRQPIYTLYRYIPACDWPNFQQELEDNDYLLRDRIGDLLLPETWDND
ncbi:DUF4327 family protein [Pseudanabaena sp. FACHB-2040]|uniref:DUF4327 family protein n=1 Tax=Pseudanabaena sp. FACHB-2040 TaxID=2692859 RepID=UPI001688D988|nr:DUF4327 family protein [Pseudanabaena sp. FACHB-2040]MBD0267782.1 DUF4327 family protein [Cyanobacteria bacterium Co-bin8]MBD2256311.1 DUF4327 family protein [Pseudanabaena sp. FACHB-2040]